MPTNKVNNNIKLKSGGGVVNDATDGLSVDTGTTDGKIVQMTTGDKLPAVDGSQLTNTHWTLISSEALGATNTIPAGTNFIIVDFRVYSDEGGTINDNTYGQFILIPSILTSARVSSGEADNATSIGLGSSISGSTITNTRYDVTSGGGRTAYSTGTVYYFK
jgi:hypothetical protein